MYNKACTHFMLNSFSLLFSPTLPLLCTPSPTPAFSAPMLVSPLCQLLTTALLGKELILYKF